MAQTPEQEVAVVHCGASLQVAGRAAEMLLIPVTEACEPQPLSG